MAYRAFGANFFYIRIWLEDLATSLLFVPLSDPLETRTYFGFDISSSQFPTVVNNNVKYKVHDVLKPFSNKHKGKFDVVHVRFLNVAVKEKDILRVTTNMMELLSRISIDRIFRKQTNSP